MAAGSLNFDRAADYYDDTRITGPETLARVIEMLGAELTGREPCLEIGIGTGRIGLPLVESGVPVVGVDLSALMVDRLVKKSSGRRLPLRLALADATALPFSSGTFAAALGSHVFHLITDWRSAVGELIRVVKPGGLILAELGPWSTLILEMRNVFAAAVGLEPSFVGTQEPRELDAEMESFGAQVRHLPEIEDHEDVVLENVILRFERGQYSQTWELDEAARSKGAAALRVWAEQTYGDAPVAVTRRIRWRAYDLPD